MESTQRLCLTQATDDANVLLAGHSARGQMAAAWSIPGDAESNAQRITQRNPRWLVEVSIASG